MRQISVPFFVKHEGSGSLQHNFEMRMSLETLKLSSFTQSGGLALLQHTITVTLEFSAVSSTAGGLRPYVIQALRCAQFTRI